MEMVLVADVRAQAAGVRVSGHRHDADPVPDLGEPEETVADVPAEDLTQVTQGAWGEVRSVERRGRRSPRPRSRWR
jgi:hypothetical protein